MDCDYLVCTPVVEVDKVSDTEPKRPIVQMLKRLSVLIESELMPIKREDSLLTAAYLDQRKVTDMLGGFLKETE